MRPDPSHALRTLLRNQQTAALGTLHKGHPYVSMVPFALLPGTARFIIHVSQLAAHTKDMLTSPHVSLLVVAPPTPELPPQALARVTIQGQAMQCTDSTHGHAEAKAAYLERFPQGLQMFGFSDFSLFTIEPSAIRFVGGFAQATSLSPETFCRVLSES